MPNEIIKKGSNGNIVYDKINIDEIDFILNPTISQLNYSLEDENDKNWHLRGTEYVCDE